MGIDGFSLSNLGATRNMTSAQLAAEAEATARQSLENQIADVDGVGKKQKAGRKDPDAAFNGTIPFVPEEEQKEQDGQDDEAPVEPEKTFEEDVDEETEEASNYHFRLNQDEMIEIYDDSKKQVIKTISPKDATKVMLNVSNAPGVFVNRKV